MRTTVYVDGYNLYYGRLQHSPYKWLDLASMLRHVLRIQNPQTEITRVAYFTAPVLARLATHGQRSVDAQNSYHRALLSTGVEVILGRHTLERGQALHYRMGQEPSRSETVPIWKLSEKETDVNLALHMYRDALHHDNSGLKQQVLVSSDTDARPVLAMIRQDIPSLQLGIILPRRPDHRRPPAGSLTQLAHWTREHLLDAELTAHQFRSRVPTRRKPADKPDYW